MDLRKQKLMKESKEKHKRSINDRIKDIAKTQNLSENEDVKSSELKHKMISGGSQPDQASM
jgi:hypothetical protein